MKEIKTKQTIKDIKMLDKATEVSRRAKTAYIRSKEQVQQSGHNEDGNYVDNAGNNMMEGAEIVVRKAGYAAGSYRKKTVQKINEHSKADTDALHSDASSGSRTQPVSNSETGRPKMEQKSTLSESKKAVKQKRIYPETSQVTGRDVLPFKTKETVRRSISQPGAKQAVQQNAVPFRATETVKRKYTLSKQSNLAKRRFVQARVKQRFVHTREIRVANLETDRSEVRLEPMRITSVRQTVQRPLFQPAEKAAPQIIHSSRQPGCTMKRSVKAGGKTVKGTANAKGTIKTAQRSLKTVWHPAKAPVKTSPAARAAARAAQATQRAAQATRAAARTAAVSAKTAAKAVAAAIKASTAAVKGMTSLIAAGGGSAFVIILVICLAGLLLGSVYGIFFSNESSAKNTPVMSGVVSQLNEEFAAKIQLIEDENPHDMLDLSINGSSSMMVGNWRDILAVYAVKVAADPKNGMEVATLEDAKVDILRNVFWDMNEIEYWLETIEHEETTEIILHIRVTFKTSSDMISEYGFNSEQVKMLNELMQEEYRQLFIRLISNYLDFTILHTGVDSNIKPHAMRGRTEQEVP